MPYPNEHAARVINPGEFQEETFRRKEIAPGVSIIIGKLKGKDSMVTQAYRFDKSKFTADEAKAWLKKNNVTTVEFSPAETKEVKIGARHSKTDQEIINSVHQMATQICQHMESLGALSEEPPKDIDPLIAWEEDLKTLKGTENGNEERG
jgi:hypothetical protein